MGTVIDATGVSRAGVRHRHSALRLAEAAGRQALAACGRPPEDVDLLINAGLYHDRNLGEPALAPLIQEDLHTSATADPVPATVGTFSFDVADGTCGVLDALEIADGFLRVGTVRTVLIVASDADPGHGLAPDFPFSPAGGALVCHWTDDPSGLGPVSWVADYDAGRSWRATLGRPSGQNVLEVVRSPTAGAAMAEVAADAARAALDEARLDPGDIDLWAVAPAEPGLGEGLSERLGIDARRVRPAPPGVHTAGLIFALGADAEARPGALTVLVAAGAGLAAGAAVYRCPVGTSRPVPHRR